MALTVENGYDLQLSIGGIVIGCAQTVKFGGSRDSKNATCTASAGVKESIPGQKSYTLTTDGLMRVATLTDVAGNYTTKNIETAFEDGTILEFEFGTDTVGATKKSGTAWISSFEESGSIDGDATFSVTFEVTGEVEYTTNPTV